MYFISQDSKSAAIAATTLLRWWRIQLSKCASLSFFNPTTYSLWCLLHPLSFQFGSLLGSLTSQVGSDMVFWQVFNVYFIAVVILIPAHFFSWKSEQKWVSYAHFKFDAQTGPLIIGDKAWRKFPKIQPICLDINSTFLPNMFGPNLAFGEFSNFVWMPHQASKKCVRISQKKNNFTYFYQVLCMKKSLSTYPVSISCPTLTFPANCYNSFDCHQYILKISLQLIEDLEVFVIEGEHSAILTECGCYSQGAEELIRWKKGIRAHM